MTPEENDPDTLQLLDELDADWVRRWQIAANKKKPAENESTFSVLLQEDTVPNEKSRRAKSV
jgi:hypothetical protein